MSPLRYQKSLRLEEAGRLIGSGREIAAAYAVGYEGAPEFSREYTRMFGTRSRTMPSASPGVGQTIAEKLPKQVQANVRPKARFRTIRVPSGRTSPMLRPLRQPGALRPNLPAP